jgi:hypothetical protein
MLGTIPLGKRAPYPSSNVVTPYTRNPPDRAGLAQVLVVSVNRDSDVIASAGVHSTLQPRP